MKRLLLATVISMLVLPGSALGAASTGARAVPSRAFYARVLRASVRGLALRLGNGHRVEFSVRQIRHAPAVVAPAGRRHPALAHVASAPRSVTTAIQALEPGVTVLVSETVDASGSAAVTIELPSVSASSVQEAGGVLGSVARDTFLLDTADGSELRLHSAPNAVSRLGLRVCEAVSVSYHQDGGMLFVDGIHPTGASTGGDCAR